MGIKMKDYQKGIASYCELAQAMIDGIKKYRDKDGFTIDMETYGKTDGEICFGCASTCMLQHLTGKELTPDLFECSDGNACAVTADLFSHSIYSPHSSSGFTRIEVGKIEQAINEFRSGYADDLIGLCKTNEKDKEIFYNEFPRCLERKSFLNFFLTSENYHFELFNVERHLKKVRNVFELEWPISC